jgi:hypothetical protein
MWFNVTIVKSKAHEAAEKKVVHPLTADEGDADEARADWVRGSAKARWFVSVERGYPFGAVRDRFTRGFPMTDPGGFWTRLKGKFVRPVADAAGDRRAEARAHLEASTGTEPAEAAVDHAHDAVERQHHETLPDS